MHGILYIEKNPDGGSPVCTVYFILRMSKRSKKLIVILSLQCIYFIIRYPPPPSPFPKMRVIIPLNEVSSSSSLFYVRCGGMNTLKGSVLRLSL